MKAAIITIGDELLNGQILNGNARWMAEQLTAHHIEVTQILSIGDNEGAIRKALDALMDEVDYILLSGGLGPTNDDITKEVLSDYFGQKLVLDKANLKRIERFISSRGGKLNENNYRQAFVPENCRILQNSIGTAAGMWFKQGNCHIISMPGVPFELKAMMEKEVLPQIAQNNGDYEIMQRFVLIQGLPEAGLAEIIAPWEKALSKNVRLAYLPSPGIIKLRLSVLYRKEEREKTEESIQQYFKELSSYIPDHILAFDEISVAAYLNKVFTSEGLTLSTAESCTGGSIAGMITSIAGSSNFYKGSIVAYSNPIKIEMLAVKSNSLKKHGAVSEQVVKEMAANVREKMQTDYAIATSGIAGPGGGSEEKPVGTTWIAVASDNQVIAEEYRFGDNRLRNILRTGMTAMHLLLKLVVSEKKLKKR